MGGRNLVIDAAAVPGNDFSQLSFMLMVFGDGCCLDRAAMVTVQSFNRASLSAVFGAKRDTVCGAGFLRAFVFSCCIGML